MGNVAHSKRRCRIMEYFGKGVKEHYRNYVNRITNNAVLLWDLLEDLSSIYSHSSLCGHGLSHSPGLQSDRTSMPYSLIPLLLFIPDLS